MVHRRPRDYGRGRDHRPCVHDQYRRPTTATSSTDSGAVAAIVSTARLAATLLPAVNVADACRLVVAIEPLRVAQTSGTTIVDWTTLLADHAPDVAAMRQQITAGRADLACLIYTSGTGGTPRGVRQHHGAILQNVAAACEIIEQDFPATPGRDRFLSFLPLSHAYEHTCGQFTAIGLGASIHYAEGIDKLAANMEEVGPTIMVVVPRLFEVLRTRIAKQVEKQGGTAITLFNAALRLGRKRYERGGTLPLLDRAYDAVLDATIRKRIAARFGGRMKALVSGGAPLNPDVGMFFAALGLTLCQGYGQTEAGPLISCNRPSRRIKMHSVGPALRGTTLRIAADGEICVRGECVMDGYWLNEVDSHRALQDGWLLTGDIGRIDADGHLVITDRKKRHPRQRQGRQHLAGAGRGDADPPARDRAGDGPRRPPAVPCRAGRPRPRMGAELGARQGHAGRPRQARPTSPSSRAW